MMKLLATICICTLLNAHPALAQSAPDSVPLYDNLGDHHVPISTDLPLAQRYFDQGMRLYYAFNHAEAIRAFEEAARLDPDCAICHWGTALAHGPNINLPMDSANAVAAYAATRRAVELQDHANPRERALIGALATRYAPDAHADRAALDSAYAQAMAAVARQHPGDTEAETLYAESLMDLSPWYYWTKTGEPRPHTPELLSTLERVMTVDPEHPGANHFYIHAVEEVDPKRAVPMAERLANAMPGAGHLVHMPGHIYIRVGRYADAIRVNEHAVHADETYIQDQRPGAGMYTLGYYPHNYDFLAFAALMAGRSEQSLRAARQISSTIPREMLGTPGMDFLQGHLARPLQMMVRFGRWDEVLATPEPAHDLLYSRALWHYARGRALVARGDVSSAEKELATLDAIADDPALGELRLEFNSPAEVVKIARNVLAGRIAEARGDPDEAVARLRAAAAVEDSLVYGEPPEWSVPVHQELGEVLLAAGRPAEAERAFRKDLEHFPENGWSLHGLAQSLRAQRKPTEADAVEARFREAWEGADVKLSSVRF